MINAYRIAVIIPAFNEESAIAKVIKGLPDYVDRVLVCDNNSTDKTTEIAVAHGAETIKVRQQGYGATCLAGVDYLKQTGPPDFLVFLDGDFADDPSYLPALIQPLLDKTADLTIGCRRDLADKGSLTPVQAFGNALACCLIYFIWRQKFSDLGPFRAICWESLMKLDMQDKGYGWTVEMQIKAAKTRLSFAEIQVPYRRRIGVSKISGTLKGTVLAGGKILYLIARFGLGFR